MKSSVITMGLVALALSAVSAASLLAQAPPAGGDSAIRRVAAEVSPCLDVRSRPSYRAPVIDCLERGREVMVSREEGDWSRVVFEGDLTGWVSSRFLLPPAAAAGTAASDEAGPEQAPADSGTALEVAAVDPVAAEILGLSERLRLAEVRAGRLEAELADARAAQAAAAAETISLEARVRELAEERDDLARQLARTEGRLLYVVGDLERTRSELMSLKGIPPRLVQPEADPEPAAPVPEPQPEPVEESAAPQPLEPPVDPNLMSIDAVLGTVRAWARAWADQRVDDYLAFYSPAFTPTGGESREVWAAQRRDRILAPRSIEITLDRLSPIVQGDLARVMFVQTYVSETFTDTVEKTLVLERVSQGTWQILEERAEAAL